MTNVTYVFPSIVSVMWVIIDAFCRALGALVKEQR